MTHSEPISSRRRLNFFANIILTVSVSDENAVFFFCRLDFKTKTTFLHFLSLDLDWEYPANRDTADHPEDKFHFTLLCKVNSTFSHAYF